MVLILTAVLCGFPVGVVLMSSFAHSYQVDKLEEDGISTRGVVDRLYVETSRGHSVSYAAGYSFPSPAGKDSAVNKISGKSQISLSDYETLHTGEQVEVIYLPTKPYISILKLTLDTSWSRPWKNFVTVSELVLGAFGSMFLIVNGALWVTYLKERHLARWGKACIAFIIDNQEITLRGVPMVMLKYQFQAEIERKRRIHKSVACEATTNPTVLYDPKRPMINLLYPPSTIEVIARG